MIRYEKIFYVLGILFFIFSGLALIPIIVDCCLGNDFPTEFVVDSIFSCFLGGVLFFSGRFFEIQEPNAREKILIILISWIVLPILAGLPFFLSSLQMSFTDSIFEAILLLTTTGSGAIYDTRSLSEGFLLWRSLLQLFGGVSFIASFVCVFPHLKSIYAPIFEVSGRYSFLGQVKAILLIYLALAFVSTFLFAGTGMSALDSLCYSFSALSTGGAIPDNTFDISGISLRVSWILPILMLIGGCPVAFVTGLFSEGVSAFKNRQFICYLCLVFLLVLLLFTQMSFPTTSSVLENLKRSFFLAISSITTTGVGLNASEAPDSFANALLYVTNFIGGCSGSCSGGIKIFRLMVMFLLIKSYLMRIVRTNAVYVPTYAGKRLEEADVTGLFSYFICYATIAVVFSITLSFFEMELGKSFGAVVTCMNNNGPFFDLHRATALEMANLGVVSKIILTAAMITGRIDFIPLFMVMLRPFWKK
jgi:trk system potassium uptake protein TrkH